MIDGLHQLLPGVGTPVFVKLPKGFRLLMAGHGNAMKENRAEPARGFKTPYDTVTPIRRIRSGSFARSRAAVAWKVNADRVAWSVIFRRART